MKKFISDKQLRRRPSIPFKQIVCSLLDDYLKLATACVMGKLFSWQRTSKTKVKCDRCTTLVLGDRQVRYCFTSEMRNLLIRGEGHNVNRVERPVELAFCRLAKKRFRFLKNCPNFYSGFGKRNVVLFFHADKTSPGVLTTLHAIAIFQMLTVVLAQTVTKMQLP